ncbi:MAG: GNAT family N-acetyltransferase [Caldimonas sp.]
MNRPTLEIRKLSPSLKDDFLAFFEGEAFRDNPKWASCFCQSLYIDHSTVDWQNRTGHENRAAACERICSDRMQGYLAYLDGKPVGWCNAAPRTMIDALADEPDPDAERMGEITCFVVARPHRRSGVATALLHAACEGLKAQGLTLAEAMPNPQAADDAQNHHGPLSMFLAAGFEVHRTEADGQVRVRRSLA